MKFKAMLMDGEALRRVLVRMSHQIIEKNKSVDDLVLIGIKTRGVPLAKIIAANIKKIEGVDIPVGELDINHYRDDLSEVNSFPKANQPSFPFEVNKKHIILVDDVLFTGRTVRAAIEAIFSQGRPSSIQLAILVDRGHRELPIRADYVGKTIPTAKSEVVKVSTPEYDGALSVELYDRDALSAK